ncbi:MAG: Bcr/CflA family efflux MFS transporter [Alphaproteobacteria bacterium]|nr:Bcr/CflA family efflux MFS transporter [Alphaproteobacteria bacterium]
MTQTPSSQTAAPPLGMTPLIVLVAMMFTSQMAITIFLPALPALAADLDRSVDAARLIIPAYLGAFAVAQLVVGPLSDAYGRRVVILAGLALFAVASFACALAPDIEMLMIARFVQATGSCTLLVISRAMVRDTSHGAAAARAMAYLGMAMGVGPAIGPILGGYLMLSGHLMDFSGWRMTFHATGAIATIVLVAGLRVLPETLPPALRQAPRIATMAHNGLRLFGLRAFMGYCLATGFAVAVFQAYLSGSPTVLITLGGLTTEEFGAYMLAAPLCFIAANLFTARIVARLGIDRLICLGSTLLAGAPAALVLAALAGVDRPWVFLVVAGAFSIGSGLVVPTTLAGAMTAVAPSMAASASALAGFFQMAISTLATLAVSAFLHESSLPTAIVMTIAGVSMVAFFALLVNPWRR